MANTAAARKTEQQKRLRINEDKWTKILMDAGWTALPSIILDKHDTKADRAHGKRRLDPPYRAP